MPEIRIDHEGEMPLYKQLAAVLRAQIADGTLPAHRAIPSKKQLTQRYEVSPGTAEKAIRMLKDEGLLRGVAGRGVFVTGASEPLPRQPPHEG